MAKGDKNAVDQSISGETNRLNTQRTDFGNQLQNYQQQAAQQGQQTYGQAEQGFGQAQQGFSQLANSNNNYGLSADDIDALWSDNGNWGNGGQAAGVGTQPAAGTGTAGAQNPGSFLQTIQGIGDQTNPSMDYYQKLIQTGGYSPSDIQQMRMQNEAPNVSAFQAAQDNLNQQRSLQGGYSPNYAASQAQVARGLSNQLNQTDIATNAALAQLVQQNKLAGAQGAGNLASQQQSALTNAEQILANKSAQQANLKQQANEFAPQIELQANQGLNTSAQGLTNLYGTPNAQLDSVLNQQNQNIAGQQQGNQNMIQDQLSAALLGSNWQNLLSNLASGSSLAKTLGSGLAGLLNGGGAEGNISKLIDSLRGNQGSSPLTQEDWANAQSGNGVVPGGFFDEAGNYQPYINDAGNLNYDNYIPSQEPNNFAPYWDVNQNQFPDSQYLDNGFTPIDQNQQINDLGNIYSSFPDNTSGWL
jgi:hypothetical protein